ncbi:RNA recognition motif rrm domain containing protein [Anaeramoeba flamelloides]|uniref:RNA recognition motif rrm domain containing protein n=1 Tax=Anaeramoeba flamelloides TaxID=1746091 RepID=A0ABQ8XGR8_9EUKA|nr:RNA recognition motif rrm domain containing protein [Anaeramoeba flamelloides]
MEKEKQEKKNQNSKKQTDQIQQKKEKKEETKKDAERNENHQDTTNKTQNNNQQEQIQNQNQQTKTTKNGEPKTKLYIGNISFNSTEESLTKAFSKYGEIKSLKIVKRGERSLGYGFLVMSTGEEATLAIKELHQTMVDGREIIVEYADPNKAKRRRNPKYSYNYSKNYSKRKIYVPYREMNQPFPMFNLSYNDSLKYYEMMNYYQMGLTFDPQDNQLFYNYPKQVTPYYNYEGNQNSNEYVNYQQQRMDGNNLENETEKENRNGNEKENEYEHGNGNGNGNEKENENYQKEIWNNNQTQKFQQQQQQERFQYYPTQRMFNNFNPYYYNENNYSNQRRVFYPYKKNRYPKPQPKNFHKNSIFITNIPFSMTDQDLIETFKELNPKNSLVVFNPYGKPRGFGFVEFESTENRDKALEFNETKLGGRIVYVKIAYGVK